jgi:YggT family protein
MITVMENLIVFVINLLVLVIIVDAVLSFIPDIQAKGIVILLKRISDIFANPIRKRIPPAKMGLDVAPLLAILILKIIQGILIRLANMLV